MKFLANLPPLPAVLIITSFVTTTIFTLCLLEYVVTEAITKYKLSKLYRK